MKDRISDFGKIKKERFGDWEVLDQALYRLCKDYPDHQSRNAINAKLWIIGRTYATGVERMISNEDGSQGGSMECLAEMFYRRNKRIDAIITRLSKHAEPLEPSKLKPILIAHRDLLAIVSEVTRPGKSARSFVSKYLHFHAPIMPIYDSVVVREIPQLVSAKKDLATLELPLKVDEKYYWYVLRFWNLYQQVKAHFPDATVKEVDRFLLNVSALRG